MHYIRLLRPPVLEAGRSEATLKLVLTITTDLGDSFLSPSEPIPLSVSGAYTEQRDQKSRLVPINFTQANAPKWQARMRVLKLDVPVPLQYWRGIKSIRIHPSNPSLTAYRTSDICAGEQGLIMTAYADISATSGASPPSVCFRSLRLPAINQLLQIEEDIGESIARHIWDAGITTVSLIAEMFLGSTESGSETPLPSLCSILQPSNQQQPLNILELGCGVGVLGIGMLRILSIGQGTTTTAHILMTDLPEAEERARANIARQPEALAAGDAAPVQLDFEPLDWEDGKQAVFGEKVAARAWDLVMLSDCTYNADMLPPLVKTLTAICRHSAGRGGKTTEVLLATKPRHSDEKILFELMEADGWAIREHTAVPLPVLDGEDQTVEVYLFGMR